jgi:transposase, IS30 family
VGPRLTLEERIETRRLHKAGLSRRQIAVAMSRSWMTIELALRPTPQTRERLWDPSAARLSLVEREEIRVGLAQGETFSVIAGRIGRAVSTVSREVKANGGPDQVPGHQGPHPGRPLCPTAQPAKLATRPELRGQVELWLRETWSPQQIARRLRCEYPADPMMWVSHETIYQSLFVQGRGELRRELTRCLRSGRAKRHHRSHGGARARKLADMVMIADRPAEVADRAVPGHWEGDLIIGKAKRSAVGTLVERTTRYVMLLHLPQGRNADAVAAAMTKAITRLPAQLARSVTWDQGREMAKHKDFTIATGVPVYFCDPHSPWQRGSNENTNGLLRQFLPKGADLSVFTRADLDEIERKMNGRPRKTLEWLKPCEKLSELIAATP